jgi:hypothetical protein
LIMNKLKPMSDNDLNVIKDKIKSIFNYHLILSRNVIIISVSFTLVIIFSILVLQTATFEESKQSLISTCFSIIFSPIFFGIMYLFSNSKEKRDLQERVKEIIPTQIKGKSTGKKTFYILTDNEPERLISVDEKKYQALKVGDKVQMHYALHSKVVLEIELEQKPASFYWNISE